MRLRAAPPLDLGYCTNIHAARGWPALRATLAQYAPALRDRLAAGADFGIGLRLSAQEAAQLLAPAALDEFTAFLRSERLYVFTLNGFPYGDFHGAPVKSAVFAPDWRTDARYRYTEQLVTILRTLLPEGASGGISTVPLSYKAWISASDGHAWQLCVQHLVQTTALLARTHAKHGRLVHLDLEPEPDGLLENTADVIAFFNGWLLPYGTPRLMRLLGTTRTEAERLLLEHIRVCLDTCHVAISYEEPAQMLKACERAGIKIGKVQLSAALALDLRAQTHADRVNSLRPFAEGIYLHQVVERHNDGRLRHYPDLSEALRCTPAASAREWRLHFHVPLFTPTCDAWETTAAHALETLSLVQASGFTEALELETYTWEVLPEGLKRGLTDSIEAEYRWALTAWSDLTSATAYQLKRESA